MIFLILAYMKHGSMGNKRDNIFYLIAPFKHLSVSLPALPEAASWGEMFVLPLAFIYHLFVHTN